eukprot:SAG31_NODE_1089_length_9972_cov_4.602856_2_plen_107_part_00
MANGTKKRAAAAGGGNPDMKVRNPIHRQDQAQQRTRVENPLFSAAEPDTDADADTLDWTDDMLQDLAFAFEACDVDHDGHIDAVRCSVKAAESGQLKFVCVRRRSC